MQVCESNHSNRYVLERTIGMSDCYEGITVVKTFQNREEARAWQDRMDPLAPGSGELAPDFCLSDVSGEDPVRISDFLGQKPVALVFGSFT